MAKSKELNAEDIEHLIFVGRKGNVEGVKMIKQFAQQECIEFAKWIDLNNIGTVAIMDYPIHLSTDAPDELYQLFINSKTK